MPGGLDTSMRTIIKDILASPVPVATFVAPEGARAASAGTYILYASHIAAMAPATDLGAATPVAIGIGGGQPGKISPQSEESASPEQPKTRETEDTQSVADAVKDKGKAAPAGPKPTAKPGTTDAMAAKSVEDASAYIRSLAQLRGRNADFAERAVREAVSLSSEEALAQKVIDLVAVDLPGLLAALDGREVEIMNGKIVLATIKAPVERFNPDWRNRILAALANPQVALILMMIGIYGLFFELMSPGFGVPGVAGAISLLVALYAFQLLPVNWTGVLLLAVGAALLLAIGSFAARSVRRPVVSGRELMAGAPGTVIGRTDDGQWWVMVHGERWRARSAAPLEQGEKVRVERLDGLTVDVSPLTDSSISRRTL